MTTKSQEAALPRGFQKSTLTLRITSPSPAVFHQLSFFFLVSKYSFTFSVNDKNLTTVKKKRDDQLSKQITGQFIQSSHSHMIIRCCHTNNFVPTIPP